MTDQPWWSLDSDTRWGAQTVRDLQSPLLSVVAQAPVVASGPDRGGIRTGAAVLASTVAATGAIAATAVTHPAQVDTAPATRVVAAARPTTDPDLEPGARPAEVLGWPGTRVRAAAVRPAQHPSVATRTGSAATRVVPVVVPRPAAPAARPIPHGPTAVPAFSIAGPPRPAAHARAVVPRAAAQPRPAAAPTAPTAPARTKFTPRSSSAPHARTALRVPGRSGSAPGAPHLLAPVPPKVSSSATPRRRATRTPAARHTPRRPAAGHGHR